MRFMDHDGLELFDATYQKSNIEDAVDHLLMLYIISKAGCVEDHLKLQKLVFLAQYEFQKRDIKALNHLFFRYNLGPFSPDLATEFNHYRSNGFVESVDNRLCLTTEGDGILQKFRKTLERNGEIVGILDAVLKRYAKLSAIDLRDEVYKMQIVPTGESRAINVRGARMNKRFLQKIEEDEADQSFKISEADASTFLVLSSPSLMKSIQAGREDMRKGNFLSRKKTFEEVR